MKADLKKCCDIKLLSVAESHEEMYDYYEKMYDKDEEMREKEEEIHEKDEEEMHDKDEEMHEKDEEMPERDDEMVEGDEEMQEKAEDMIKKLEMQKNDRGMNGEKLASHKLSSSGLQASLCPWLLPVLSSLLQVLAFEPIE